MSCLCNGVAGMIVTYIIPSVRSQFEYACVPCDLYQIKDISNLGKSANKSSKIYQTRLLKIKWLQE